MSAWSLRSPLFFGIAQELGSVMISMHRFGNAVYKFLKNKLKLTINRDKSGIRRPVNFTILGFGFVPHYQENHSYEFRRTYHETQ